MTAQVVVVPVGLDYDVAFGPTEDDARDLAGRWQISCVVPDGPVAAGNASVFTVQPWNSPEFGEPGVSEPCGWTPPAQGCVTLSATITYQIALVVNGHQSAEPIHQWDAPSETTFSAGELRAVNVNEDLDPIRPTRASLVPNCS